MSYERDRRGDIDSDWYGDSYSQPTPAPGRSTLTSRIQLRAVAAAPASAPSPQPVPTPALLPSARDATEPYVDPFGLHLMAQSPPVQCMQTQAAATIDAPKEVDETRGTLALAPREEREVAIAPRAGSADEGVGSAAPTPVPLDSPAGAGMHTQAAAMSDTPKDADGLVAPAQLLAPPRLAIARRRNVRHHHRLRFDVGAFGGASPDSNEFALAVAAFQASTGGALGVDGIAGPQTCKHKGCLPSSHAAGHATAHEDDESADEATSSLESTRDRRDAVGAAERAQPSAIDQPKEDSLANNRDTLAVQARADGPLALDPEQVHAHAAAGVQGAGGPMPHAAQIKASFGAHAPVVDGIQAHVGGAAADASKAIGAEAYATGNAVALKSAPDVFTAAHEAAHVVQQQAGVQLLGGVGEVGDVYERNADEVAAKVVQGESAEHLLGHTIRPATAAVQRAPAAPTAGDAAPQTAEGARSDLRNDRLNSYKGALLALVAKQLLGITEADARLSAETPALLPASALAPGVIGQIAAVAISKGTAALLAAVTVAEPGLGIIAGFAASKLREQFNGRANAPIANVQHDLLRTYIQAHREAHTNHEAAIEEAWPEIAAKVNGLGDADLERLRHATFAHARSPTIAQEQQRATIIQWANVVAQAHHGASPGWDSWSPQGSLNAVATDHAAPGPDRNSATKDPTGSNIDPKKAQPILDNDTKEDQETQHGILQVDLLFAGDSYEVEPYHVRGAPVRMEGVPLAVLAQLRTLGTIRDARVNKIIRVWRDEGPRARNLNPLLVILETADGYIRDQKFFPGKHWNGMDYGDLELTLDPKLAPVAVAYANSLPASLIK